LSHRAAALISDAKKRSASGRRCPLTVGVASSVAVRTSAASWSPASMAARKSASAASTGKVLAAFAALD